MNPRNVMMTEDPERYSAPPEDREPEKEAEDFLDYQEAAYDYTVSYLHGKKIKGMSVKAGTRDHARRIFEGRIADMQAFTESGTDIFTILSIRQLP